LTGCWRKLLNEELHNLYSSASIIRMLKSRRMRRTGLAARMDERGMNIVFWWETQKERGLYEELDGCGRIILQ
jgi:hypothetical protein